MGDVKDDVLGGRSTSSYSKANQQILWHGNEGGRRDINTYLTEAMDMRNQLIKAHGETISSGKTPVDLVLQRVPEELRNGDPRSRHLHGEPII